MKFPRLSDSELKSLETAFIEFLVVQGVDDATWRTLNQNEPQKALGLVDLFSHIVWKKILDETRYLVRKLEGETCYVYLGDQEGELIFFQMDEHDEARYVVNRGRKTWLENRSEIVWDFFQQGFVRSSEEEYLTIKKELKTEK